MSNRNRISSSVVSFVVVFLAVPSSSDADARAESASTPGRNVPDPLGSTPSFVGWPDKPFVEPRRAASTWRRPITSKCFLSSDGRVSVWKSGGVGDEVEVSRLAELTIALSLATDLGTGQPLEHGLRTCSLSLKVAEALGLDAGQRSCVYHVPKLRTMYQTSLIGMPAEGTVDM